MLGNFFFRDFVTSFEYETGTVKFGLNVNALNGANVEKIKVKEPDKTWIIILILSIILVLLILGCCVAMIMFR